jgi:hypothetical protein
MIPRLFFSVARYAGSRDLGAGKPPPEGGGYGSLAAYGGSRDGVLIPTNPEPVAAPPVQPPATLMHPSGARPLAIDLEQSGLRTNHALTTDSSVAACSGFFLMSKNSSPMPMQIAESATLKAGQWCSRPPKFTYTSRKSTT